MGHTVFVTFRLVCHSCCLNLPVTRLVVNNLFRQQQIRSHHSSTVLTLCDGEKPVTGAFPYKGTVMRKAFQSRDIIMKHHCICTIRVEQHQSYLAARWRISLFISYFSSYESSFSGQIGCQYLGFFAKISAPLKRILTSSSNINGRHDTIQITSDTIRVALMDNFPTQGRLNIDEYNLRLATIMLWPICTYFCWSLSMVSLQFWIVFRTRYLI